MDRKWSEEFAAEWITAWNSHDIERILSHYADDFEMESPLIVERMGEPSGKLCGKEKIRPYWRMGLDAAPPLQFELIAAYAGVSSIVIHYRSVGRTLVCETIHFNDAGLGVRAAAHYGAAA